MILIFTGDLFENKPPASVLIVMECLEGGRGEIGRVLFLDCNLTWLLTILKCD